MSDNVIFALRIQDLRYFQAGYAVWLQFMHFLTIIANQIWRIEFGAKWQYKNLLLSSRHPSNPPAGGFTEAYSFSCNVNGSQRYIPGWPVLLHTRKGSI